MVQTYPGSRNFSTSRNVSSKQSSTSKASSILCQATYDFEGEESDELSFEKGDYIVVLESSDPDWWQGYLKEDDTKGVGLFPCNHVKILPTPEKSQKRKSPPRLNKDPSLTRKKEGGDKFFFDTASSVEVNERMDKSRYHNESSSDETDSIVDDIINSGSRYSDSDNSDDYMEERDEGSVALQPKNDKDIGKSQKITPPPPSAPPPNKDRGKSSSIKFKNVKSINTEGNKASDSKTHKINKLKQNAKEKPTSKMNSPEKSNIIKDCHQSPLALLRIESELSSTLIKCATSAIAEVESIMENVVYNKGGILIQAPKPIPENRNVSIEKSQERRGILQKHLKKKENFSNNRQVESATIKETGESSDEDGENETDNDENVSSYETRLGNEFLHRLQRLTKVDDYGLYQISFETLCEELKGLLDRHVQLRSTDDEEGNTIENKNNSPAYLKQKPKNSQKRSNKFINNHSKEKVTPSSQAKKEKQRSTPKKKIENGYDSDMNDEAMSSSTSDDNESDASQEKERKKKDNKRQNKIHTPQRPQQNRNRGPEKIANKKNPPIMEKKPTVNTFTPNRKQQKLMREKEKKVPIEEPVSPTSNQSDSEDKIVSEETKSTDQKQSTKKDKYNNGQENSTDMKLSSNETSDNGNDPIAEGNTVDESEEKKNIGEGEVAVDDEANQTVNNDKKNADSIANNMDKNEKLTKSLPKMKANTNDELPKASPKNSTNPKSKDKTREEDKNSLLPENDTSINRALETFEKQIRFLFNAYMNAFGSFEEKKQGMKLELFLRILTDFGVGRTVITRKKVSAIFRFITQKHNQNMKANKANFMSEEQFSWSLVYCALDTYSHLDAMEDQEKVNVFLTHMGLNDEVSLKKWVNSTLAKRNTSKNS